MVSYKGMECLSPSVTNMDDTFMAFYNVSQSGTTAWAYQANYSVWCMYYAAVLAFIVVLRKALYMYADWGYRNTKLGFKQFKGLGIFDRITALSRTVAYRRIPLILSRITGLPANLGTIVVLASSFIFVICLNFAPGYLYRECFGFGSPPLATRTGVMATALTPFIIIMSGKTNFISFVTGISYEKLNIFHQSLGWLAFLLSMLHTFPFIVQPVREGGLANLKLQWQTNYLYVNGVPPLVFIFVLCFLSTRFSRGLAYEVWFHSHWIIGVAYVATLWYHVYDLLASDKYIWATMVFWGFQMIYRMMVKTTFKPNQYSFKSKRAELKLLPGDVYEVCVEINNKQELDWMPGQHIFIKFMHGMHTLDNHPFSILTIPEYNGKSVMKLVVKPQKGLTKKLYNQLRDDKTKKDLRCFIDGPYGGMNRDPLAFDKLVLVSTGTGVSVTLPFMSYVASHLWTVTSCVQKVEFLWVVHSESAVEWIRDELNSVLAKASKEDILSSFDIKIFVTNSNEGPDPQKITSNSQLPVGPTSSSEDTSSKESITKESTSKEAIDSFSDCIKIYRHTKPDFSLLLKDTNLLPKTAFICSGTGSVQEACGNAVSSLQSRVLSGEVQEVYLHTENFGW